MCGPKSTGRPCPAGSSTFCPPRRTKLPPPKTRVARRYAVESSPMVSRMTTCAVPAAGPPDRRRTESPACAARPRTRLPRSGERGLRRKAEDPARALEIAGRNDEVQVGPALQQTEVDREERLFLALVRGASHEHRRARAQTHLGPQRLDPAGRGG